MTYLAVAALAGWVGWLAKTVAAFRPDPDWFDIYDDDSDTLG